MCGSALQNNRRKAELDELRGLEIDRADADPAMSALDLGPDHDGGNHQGEADTVDDERNPPGGPEVEQGGGEQHHEARRHIGELAVEEMEVRQAEARR